MKDYSKDAAVDSNRFSPCHYFWYRIVTYIVLVTFSSSLIAPTALAAAPTSEKDSSSQKATHSSNSKTNKIEKTTKAKVDNKTTFNEPKHIVINSKTNNQETVKPYSVLSKETKTHLFFSPQSEYQPYVEIGGAKYFNQNTSVAGIYDLFIPLLQNDTNLIFTDLRIFDRSGSSFEGNVHLGYRKLFPNINQMIGIYGAFDRKRSDVANDYNQWTVGFEYWNNKLFIGGNFYKPVGITKKDSGKPVIADGRDIKGLEVTETARINRYQEKVLPGGDGEIGYAFTDSLTGYAGGYYFTSSDTSSIAGPKVRLTYDYQKSTGRLLGALDGVSVEVGAQHDKPRGATAYVGLRFKIGLLGLINEKTSNKSGFERHMIDLVRRDPDIIVGKAETPETKKIIITNKYSLPSDIDGPFSDDRYKTEDLIKYKKLFLEALGLPQNVSDEEIHKAVSSFRIKNHSDKSDAENAGKIFTEKKIYYSPLISITRELSRRAKNKANNKERPFVLNENHNKGHSFDVYVGAGVESNTLNNTNNALTDVGTNLSEPNYKYSNLDIEKVLTYKILEDVATKDTKTTNEKTNLRNIAIISPLSQKDLEILADQFRESLKKELKIPGRKILLPVYLDDKSHWVSTLLENKEGTIDVKYFDSALNDKLNNPNWLQVLLEKVYGEKEKISFVYGDALQQTINSVGCGVFAVENLIKGIGLNTSKTIDEIAIREEHSALIDKYKGQDLDILKQELEKLDIFLRDFGDVLLPTGVIRGRSRTKVGGGAGDTVTLNPVLVGSLDTDGYAYDVKVVGDYAYVADYYKGLKIINIANRAAPYLVGSLDTNGSACDVKVVGDYAYMADGYAGLKIVDITTKTEPALVGSLDTDEYAFEVVVVGNYAYVADNVAGLKIINIANPAAPVLVGSLDTDGHACDVKVVGDYAYVADRLEGLKIINIEDPAYPSLVSSLDTDGYAQGITVVGDYAYVADGNAGLKIVDITTKTVPALVGSLDTDEYAFEVVVVGNYAYVADDVAGLKIINIADPGTPFLVESLDTGGGVIGVTVAGNYAYVADYDKGLKVIEIQRLISKVGTEDAPIFFSQAEFNFSLGSFTKIQVTSLPNYGTLKLSGTAVTLNQEIFVGSLGSLTFNPNLNWNGNTAFGWKGYDGTAYSASAANVDINISAVNDPPTIIGFSKTGTEDTDVTFSQTDFTSKFTDVDSDSLTKIQITSLSSNGILKLLETAVTVNDEIAAANLGSLTFNPNLNWNGNTSFSWKGYDGTTYSASAANVNIALTSVQDLPVVSAIPKSGTEDTDVTFSQTDFTSKFTDVDGDSLTQIQITSLPSNGILKLLETAVTVNDEIVAASLSSLTFNPNLNWNGNTSFSWKGYDGFDYSESTANVDINISAVNDPPTVSNVSKTGTEDTDVTFSQTDFTNKFTDVDSDSLTQIKVTSLPSSGILKLSGAAVTLNQEIFVGSLGSLTFNPNLNWNGNTSFSWKGYDGFAYSTSEANVDINISAVNDPPTIIGFSKTGTEDTDVTFSSEDFMSKFGDVDGDDLTKIQIIDLPLPNHGTLKLSNSLVAADQEIAVEDLDSLTFEPNLNWNGNTSFSWKGYDGFAYSASAANVNIDLTPVQDLPIVSAIPKSGTEDTDVTFSQTDFTSKFTDVDGDSLTKIQITSLPSNGILKLLETAVTVNDEIAAANLGSLTFNPNLNWNGNTSFSWKGYDGFAYSTSAANVDINISAVNDPPTIVGEPGLVGSYDFADADSYAYGVTVVGNYAYVAADHYLRVINIANPTAPSLVGSYYDGNGDTFGIVVVGSYAYVANWWGL